MSGRIDHAKAKRRERSGHPAPGRVSLRGWRTEYPEEFPVTVTRKAPAMNDIRPIDYNGHVPAEPKTDPAADLLEALQEAQERAYQIAEALGYSRDELDQAAQAA